MVMFGNDSDPGVTTLQLTKTYQFWKFLKTYPKPVKRSHMDDGQDGGSNPPISTKNNF